MDRRTLGETAHELVEEFFGGDLEVEGVSAVFDADVEELWKVRLCVCLCGLRMVYMAYVEGEHGDIGVSVVDVVYYRHGRFSRSSLRFHISSLIRLMWRTISALTHCPFCC